MLLLLLLAIFSNAYDSEPREIARLIQTKPGSPYQFATLKQGAFYEVKLDITTYCNSIYVFDPVSHIISVSSNGRAFYINGNYNERTKKYNRTIYFNNLNEETSLYIISGEGCPDLEKGNLYIIHNFEINEINWQTYLLKSSLFEFMFYFIIAIPVCIMIGCYDRMLNY